MQDALERAEEYNEEGMDVLLNELGEDIRQVEAAEVAVSRYRELVSAIVERGIGGCISVKLTHLGLAFDRQLCSSGMRTIVGDAMRSGTAVWLDMEDARYTEDTLRVYFDLLDEYDGVAVCIQGNLKRTEGDISRILARGGRIRLVKGAYGESPQIAYRTREEVNQNFGKLMELLFKEGESFAIATHDDRFVDRAIELNRDYGRDLEFQLLMGIRDDLKRRLVDEGHRVGVYIPYGKEWMAYIYRRIREKPSNILLVARSLLP
ncbi:MAG: proline dehydrogenase family protein [Candidatus Geothermarchaeales archaeon]